MNTSDQHRLPDQLNRRHYPHPYPASKLSLSEEIRLLRFLMEKKAEEEASFTAKQVIELSTALDQKINEYMNLQRGRPTG